MNDSPYGLTASLWTNSESDFLELVDSLETGTVFQNRCDYLDPALAWTGVKHSGRGVSLSKFGELICPKLSSSASNILSCRL
jgi:acyl-CoA reductase-like NAD-dependent aldehyde dehydrogenase